MTVSDSQVVIYKTPSGFVSLEARFQGEGWLSLNQMAELFARDKSVISRHLGKIFKEEELGRDSVVAFLATAAADGRVVYELYGLAKEEITIVERRRK